jgi:hypothetical protein
MMEAVRTSETSADNYFTLQYIPEDNSDLLSMSLCVCPDVSNFEPVGWFLWKSVGRPYQPSDLDAIISNPVPSAFQNGGFSTF